MADILERIITQKRAEIEATNYDGVHKAAENCTRKVISMSEALKKSSSGIIAEFKRRSPSKGWINQEADVTEIVGGYQRAGAAACSILTDHEFFGGTLADLHTARVAAPNIPLLRKEFIVDPRQIYEARTAGADAVLLIAACLSIEECANLAAVAHSVGLEVLLEVHTESELGHLNENIDMLGINNRNLGTFVTDIENSFRMANAIRNVGNEIVLVSESGLSSATTIRCLQEVGFRGFLMGETFMKTANPAQELTNLIEELC